MPRLVFRPQILPRTTTRGQWDMIYRRKREMVQEFAKHDELLRISLKGLIEAGQHEFAAKVADHIIHPPICLWP